MTTESEEWKTGDIVKSIEDGKEVMVVEMKPKHMLGRPDQPFKDYDKGFTFGYVKKGDVYPNGWGYIEKYFKTTKPNKLEKKLRGNKKKGGRKIWKK